MDIRNIANNGNLDRTNDRAERTVVLRPPADAPAMQDQDHATISAKGRDTLAALEGLAERARKSGSERQAIVEAAQARLLSGELAAPDAIAKAAQGLLDSGFLAG